LDVDIKPDRRIEGNSRQVEVAAVRVSQAPHPRAHAVTISYPGPTQAPRPQAKNQLLDQFDRDYLLKTIYLSQGSLQQALEISGMHKKNFYTKLKELGLAIKDFSSMQKRE
jgi:DNA-binding NtrC family response regulator